MKLAFIFIICMIFFTQCTENINHIKIKEFKNTMTLAGDSVFYTIDPHYIDIIDTLILIGNLHDDAFFHLYNLNSYEHLKSFGRKGKGPGELLYPFYYGQHEKMDKTTKMWVTDVDAQRMYVYNLNELISADNNMPVNQYPFPIELDNLHHVFMTDNKIIASSFWGSKLSRMMQYNLNSKKIFANDFITDLNFKAHPDDMPIVAWSENKIKPDYTKIVSALSAFKQIDIFDVETNELEICLDLSSKNVTDFTNEMKIETWYYVDIEVTNDYIFALCLNSQYIEKQESGQEIQVFSWAGDALCKLNINESIKSIAIDVNNNRIYGADLYGCTVFKYDIPKDILNMKKTTKY